MSTLPSSSSSSSSKPSQSNSETRWRSGAQERLYSSRLVDALQAARNRAQLPVGSRAVKDAADSALALTARGRSRWSRAILLNRRTCKRRVVVKTGAKIRSSKKRHVAVSEPGKEERVEDRLKKLGKLVPGCKKLSPANLLEETADYVAALELQVRTMRALAEALSAASVSGADVADPVAGERS